MNNLIKAFQEGNIDEFRRLFPETDLGGINVTDLLYTLFDSSKLKQQRAIMDIVKGRG